MNINDLELGEIYQFKYINYDILCIYEGISSKENTRLRNWRYSFKVISSINNRWDSPTINLNEALIKSSLQKL